MFSKAGVRYYNFCGARVNPEKGSKAEGINRFKERFGGEFIQGYMWKHSIRPFGSMVYNLAVRVLRGGDIVDRECHKMKKFNLIESEANICKEDNLC